MIDAEAGATRPVRALRRGRLKAHRTASSLRTSAADEGRAEHQAARRHRREGAPIRSFMSACQASEDTGTAALQGSLPGAEWQVADRGHDAEWFGNALKDKGIRPARG